MSTPDQERPRAIELEVEVPGTPEEVWEAIATGPGITSWFVPTTVDGRVGGEVTQHFGPGMDETGRVTAFDRPHRFVYEGGEPRLAFEWLVQARDGGGGCVVRLVNSGFGSGEDWDGQYDSMTTGWRQFLGILRLYLTHFAGQRCAPVLAFGSADGPAPKAWERLTGTLGVPADLARGERAEARGDGVPPLAGTVVERVTGGMATLLLDAPARGLASLTAEAWGDGAVVSVQLYLYGDGAEAAAERDDPLWQAWIRRHFPTTEAATLEGGAPTA
jgi:uncharacterized protein YndB with AHSA1/START domain